MNNRRNKQRLTRIGLLTWQQRYDGYYLRHAWKGVLYGNGIPLCDATFALNRRGGPTPQAIALKRVRDRQHPIRSCTVTVALDGLNVDSLRAALFGSGPSLPQT